jgi:phage terminase large subunit GpA-like protein
MSATIQAFSAAMRPPSRLTPAEWCAENVKLPHSDIGRFDVLGSPWLVEPLNAIADQEIRQIDLLMPTGGGKTSFYEAAICYAFSESPGPLFYYELNDANAREWNETRLQQTLRATPETAKLLPLDPKKVRRDAIIASHMPILIGGANMSNAQAKSVRYAMMDECWDYEHGMMRQITARLHDRWNGKRISGSQGGHEKTEWHESWMLSTRSVFSWTCRQCGNVHPYRFADIDYDAGGLPYPEYDIHQVDETTCMVCPTCSEQYKDNANVRRMLASEAKYVPKNPKAERGHVGYQVSAMAIYRISWATLVHERLQAEAAMKRGDIELMKSWKMKRLAEFWADSPEKNRPKIEPGEHLMAEYENGEKWDGELYRFMTIDRQMDHFWVAIRAWRADGESRLLYYGKEATEKRLVDLQVQYSIRPMHVFQDSGWQAGQVYAACAKHGWVALKGDKADNYRHDLNGVKSRKFFSEPQIMDVAEGRLFLMFWSNRNVKDVLFRLRTGDGVAWEIPADVPRDWLTQIDTEVLKERPDKDGKPETRWVRIQRDNHAWDCEAMQVVAAMIVGILGSGEA